MSSCVVLPPSPACHSLIKVFANNRAFTINLETRGPISPATALQKNETEDRHRGHAFDVGLPCGFKNIVARPFPEIIAARGIAESQARIGGYRTNLCEVSESVVTYR